MTVDVNKMTKWPLPLYLIEKCFPRIQSFQKCSYTKSTRTYFVLVRPRKFVSFPAVINYTQNYIMENERNCSDNHNKTQWAFYRSIHQTYAMVSTHSGLGCCFHRDHSEIYWNCCSISLYYGLIGLIFSIAWQHWNQTFALCSSWKKKWCREFCKICLEWVLRLTRTYLKIPNLEHASYYLY